jgi:hypothetical protein
LPVADATRAVPTIGATAARTRLPRVHAHLRIRQHRHRHDRLGVPGCRLVVAVDRVGSVAPVADPPGLLDDGSHPARDPILAPS